MPTSERRSDDHLLSSSMLVKPVRGGSVKCLRIRPTSSRNEKVVALLRVPAGPSPVCGRADEALGSHDAWQMLVQGRMLILDGV
eukprot:3708011-Pleurochrysis_carterae.AAC.6